MQDKVFIEDLEVETIIGIFGWERKVKQIVKISLEMDFNISDAAKTDNIDQALDYKSIGKDISSFVGKSSFQLVETMADKIAKRVLKNKSIEKVEVKVEKPGALRGSKSVGIKIVRKNGAKVIGIMPGDTPLANICDFPLTINVGSNNRISKPVTSRIAYTAVIDVLTMGVAQLKPEAQDHLYNIADSQRSLKVDN